MALFRYIYRNKRRMFLWWFVIGVFYLIFANISVEKVSEPYIYELEDIPGWYDEAMMLGTSTRLADGETWNAFHFNRVQAVLELFTDQKIERVLVSWDNGTVAYNEPEDMKNDLMYFGVPESKIDMDFAGFRTFDSVVRTRSAFGLDNVIIVSQRFHIERALVIAQAKGIDAIWYAAKDVSVELAPRVYVREVIARAWMLLDLYLFGTEAKFEV